MKSNIVRALLWGISIFIGLCIVNLIKGERIDFLMAVIGGIIFGIIEFIINLRKVVK